MDTTNQPNTLLADAYFTEQSVKTYPKSYTTYDDTAFILFKNEGEKFLYVKGISPLFKALEGEMIADAERGEARASSKVGRAKSIPDR